MDYRKNELTDVNKGIAIKLNMGKNNNNLTV